MNGLFPVSKSFLSIDSLSHVIETEYGLSNVRCMLITAFMRDVYQVTSDGQSHILYIYRHDQRTAEEINAEWRFVEYLDANGISVAPAIPRQGGALLLSFHAPEGVRYGVLTVFVPGEHLRRRPSVEAIRSYGHIIARIHTLSDATHHSLKRPPNDVKRILDQSIAAFAAALPDRPQDLALMKESSAVILGKVESLPKERPYYGMIHGDVIRANAQVRDDGSVTVLDFDLCGPGWRAYDIASYLSVVRGQPEEKESERAFLAGYQEIRAIEEVERKALPLFEAVRAIFSMGIPAQNVYHWGSAYLYAYLDDSLNRLRCAMSRIG